jgi:hypothetical protein
LLRAGPNLLTIHALNHRVDDEDVLVVPELQLQWSADIESTIARHFASPSPGGANGEVSFGGLTAATPNVSVDSGLFDQPFDALISSDVPGATLAFTTDGSVPARDNGTLVPAPGPQTPASTSIHITGTTVLRVVAFEEDFMPSPAESRTDILPIDVAKQDYEATLATGFPEQWGSRLPGDGAPDYGFDPDVVGPNDLFDGICSTQLISSLKAAPTISIAMDLDDLFDPETGIYSNPTRIGRAWERPASLEWISSDGSPGFQVDTGIRIMGGYSRRASKKNSFRLEFRSQYGPSRL